MTEKSEVFSGVEVAEKEANRAGFSSWVRHRRNLVEVAIVFALIFAAVWTPQGRLNQFFSITGAACVVAFAAAGKWTASEMGLARPRAGLGVIVVCGALLCGSIALAGIALRFAGAGNPLPWSRSWEYALWATAQEFILQSIFFLRLETVFEPKHAVAAAAILFALVHLPSPLLTVLALCGGVVFCELFRRWRNLYPVGIIHAGLGLTIAATLPDKWLHHMRVGIGFVLSH